MAEESAQPHDWFAEALAMTPERGAVEVAGASIETRAWGERGRPGLLLMHGAGAHADWWGFIAPFFARDHRVAALSWSGMGGSSWRDAYSMDLYAEEAFATAEAAGLFEAEEKPVFAAHSFGGRIALRCAAGLRGAELRAAVVIDTLIRPPGVSVGGRPFDSRNTRVYPTPEAALARFRLVPPQPCANRALFDYIACGSIRRVEDGDGAEGWTWRFDPQIWDKLTDAPTAEDLARPACPIAAIQGARSALMIPEVTDYFRATAPPGAPVAIVPEAHHHIMLDQPLALVAALRGLLAGWPRENPR
jgi:pimeloyl-ACP methyl ester carboxylesterase